MTSKASPTFVTKEKELLIDVARTIGSALGTVAATMNQAKKAVPRRKLKAKTASVKRAVTGAAKKARTKARSVRTKVTRAAKKARSKAKR
jgi:hypothetical protein